MEEQEELEELIKKEVGMVILLSFPKLDLKTFERVNCVIDIENNKNEEYIQFNSKEKMNGEEIEFYTKFEIIKHKNTYPIDYLRTFCSKKKISFNIYYLQNIKFVSFINYNEPTPNRFELLLLKDNTNDNTKKYNIYNICKKTDSPFDDNFEIFDKNTGILLGKDSVELIELISIIEKNIYANLGDKTCNYIVETIYLSMLRQSIGLNKSPIQFKYIGPYNLSNVEDKISNAIPEINTEIPCLLRFIGTSILPEKYKGKINPILKQKTNIDTEHAVNLFIFKDFVILIDSSLALYCYLLEPNKRCNLNLFREDSLLNKIILPFELPILDKKTNEVDLNQLIDLYSIQKGPCCRTWTILFNFEISKAIIRNPEMNPYNIVTTKFDEIMLRTASRISKLIDKEPIIYIPDDIKNPYVAENLRINEKYELQRSERFGTFFAMKEVEEQDNSKCVDVNVLNKVLKRLSLKEININNQSCGIA